ncbi:hypothetical protein [Chromobacterium violaceum]|uniref:hypothetical protein n=1 Tax=Chromobacterium violaceum TaxID=536 RepID=UPI001C8C9EFE|nr:hypothetical protein [Chromobacterium violaceum]MBX9267503.1 hypothetical protein [Chromobacterium violaceum]
MIQLENSIQFLADNHAAINKHTADNSLCLLAGSHAEALQMEVTAAVTLLGELLTNYPRDVGVDDAVLQHLSVTMRLLGAVGRFARDEAALIAMTRALPGKKGGRK